MTPPTTRQSRKAETRRHLRDTARRLFTDDGYEPTSIGAITRAAGVAHGTFYVHFESKEAVLDELLGEFNEDLAVRLGPVWAEAGAAGLEAVVRRTADVFLGHWEEHRGFVAVYARRMGAGVRLEQVRDGINPPAADLLTSALAGLAGDAAIPEPELVAQGLLASWLRIGLQHLFGQDVGRERAAAALVHLTLGALRAPPGGAP